jgi:hypothetical protein
MCVVGMSWAGYCFIENRLYDDGGLEFALLAGIIVIVYYYVMMMVSLMFSWY